MSQMTTVTMMVESPVILDDRISLFSYRRSPDVLRAALPAPNTADEMNNCFVVYVPDRFLSERIYDNIDSDDPASQFVKMALDLGVSNLLAQLSESIVERLLGATAKARINGGYAYMILQSSTNKPAMDDPEEPIFKPKPPVEPKR